MYLAVMALLRLHAELLAAGREREIADDCAFPFPMQIEGTLVVMPHPDDLADAYRAHRRAFADTGLPTFVPLVSAIELPRRGRFRVWVRWAHHFGERVVEDASFAIYFIQRRPDGSLVIEMVDHTRVSRAAIKSFRPRRRAVG